MIQQNFNGIELNVYPTNDARQWYMTIDQIAAAYGVDRTAIMHTMRRHADELSMGVCNADSPEGDGVTNCHTVSMLDTLGRTQQMTVLYREDVIKLGFFMRGERAKAFRTFAAHLVIQYMDQNGLHSPDAFSTLLAAVQQGFADVNNKLDYFIGLDLTVFGNRAQIIKEKLEKAARRQGITVPEMWGRVRRDCDVSSYKLQNRKIENYLDIQAGEAGVTLVKDIT